jgi:hypothetical protein
MGMIHGSIYRWVAKFMNGYMQLKDAVRTGHPTTTPTNDILKTEILAVYNSRNVIGSTQCMKCASKMD